jgi:hypothetical protein
MDPLNFLHMATFAHRANIRILEMHAVPSGGAIVRATTDIPGRTFVMRWDGQVFRAGKGSFEDEEQAIQAYTDAIREHI